jgi:PPOX class probable F420-dependent enzyme
MGCWCNDGAMSVAERIANGLTRFYNRSRSDKAVQAATVSATGSIDSLKGRKYCVLVTYKKDGTPMPSPLWFGVGDGKVYAESGANDWKIKRIGNNPQVRVAPCNSRGVPKGAPFTGTARILSGPDAEAADHFIQANYGWYRTVYERLLAHRLPTVVIEVTPLSA